MRLAQGGIGFSSRIPIYFADCVGGQRFWGFTNATILQTDLLSGAALNDLAGLGFEYVLWKLEPESGSKQQMDIVGKMTALKAYGVGFSLDDFGTGYSSLSYLKRLPLDQLKIDQSFVRDVLTDPNDAAIARTIVALGQSLNLAVMAEGVETTGQHDFLLAHGCHYCQGYLFSRPLPEAQFRAFLHTVQSVAALP